MNDRRKFIKSTSLLVAAAGTCGYSVVHSKVYTTSIGKKQKKGMIQHNVYFWLKEEVTEQENIAFQKGLKDFVSEIKEVQKAEIGIPANTPDRDVVDHSFGYSLFVWFKNVEDHNVYQSHPAHDRFINDFSKLWSKVQVYDSNLI